MTAESNLQAAHDHYLDFPLLRKDFENWGSAGAAVILKDKIVVVPEALDRKGVFFSVNKNPFVDAW